MSIRSIISGDFLVIVNPFSATSEAPLRHRFTKADDGLWRAWTRTIMLMPGAIICAFLFRPIYQWAGIDLDSMPFLKAFARFVEMSPLVVAAVGLVVVLVRYWQRHALLRAKQKGDRGSA
ncbi:hypothetical protein AX777_25105 [Sphingobium yanoikuyae]|uniref:Uncharacterized protein n=1 Tax=Sphingobium yanoikuyae TaxID=13690 RepID=A0A177K4H0_SPHYA|nr:hypothetical protein [Sphingobium yanoikuyae]OAH48340.1 hypothetical protein AX777_25105 [Sphingobium yanoikuyae]